MKSYKELVEYFYKENSPDLTKITNLNLALNKIIKKEVVEKSELKKDFLYTFDKFGKISSDKIILTLKSRNEEQLKSLKLYGYNDLVNKPFTTQSRLVVGLGNEHILETALTLHHTFGIPYIPATALKGVCRMVAFWKLAEKKEKKELDDLQEKFYGNLVKDDEKILAYQLLFGAMDFKGLLLFLDAYPVIEGDGKLFDLDIMNVHYQDYYGDGSGKTPPADWANPVPIYFLTVKPKTKFHIVAMFDQYGWKKVKTDEGFKNLGAVEKNIEELTNKDNKFLTEIVKEALGKFGVGAKTQLGYGILE